MSACVPLCAVCGSASGFRWGSRPLASGEWRVAVECCGNGDTSGDGVSENGVRRVSAPATTVHRGERTLDRRAVFVYLYRLAFTVYVRGFAGGGRVRLEDEVFKFLHLQQKW